MKSKNPYLSLESFLSSHSGGESEQINRDVISLLVSNEHGCDEVHGLLQASAV